MCVSGEVLYSTVDSIIEIALVHGTLPGLLYLLSTLSTPASLDHLPVCHSAFPAANRFPPPCILKGCLLVPRDDRLPPNKHCMRLTLNAQIFPAMLRVWAWLTPSRLQVPSFAQLGWVCMFAGLLSSLLRYFRWALALAFKDLVQKCHSVLHNVLCFFFLMQPCTLL